MDGPVDEGRDGQVVEIGDAVNADPGSALGVIGLALFGSLHHQRHHDALAVSDHVFHWVALGLYAAIAVLAIPPLHTLRIEGVLLTVLVLLGVHVALRLMFAIVTPSSDDTATAPSAANRSGNV